MKLRLPLRHSIPALILVVGIAVLLLAWQIESRALQRNLLELAEHQLRSNAGYVSAELEAAFRNRDSVSARAFVERAISEPELKLVMLADPQGNVRYSSEPQQIGKPLVEISQARFLAESIEMAVPAASAPDAVAVAVLSKQGVVAGRFPVQMRGVERDFLPDEFGQLFMLYDISREMAQQHEQLLLRMAPRAIVLAMLSLGLWLLFRWLLLERLNRLVASVRAVAKGDFSQEPDISGVDELAELGDEVSDMIRNLREQSEALAFLADHDALTGLLNRHGFELELDRVLRQPRNVSSRYAICLMDIDSLRVVNDTRGHMVGDELLRSFGEFIQDRIEIAGAIARVGGDEYAMLLETGGDPLEGVATRIQQLIRKFRFSWGKDQIHLQVSLGMAALDAEQMTAENALGYADTACYVAKERGRGSHAIWRSGNEDWTKAHGEMKWVSVIQNALDEDRLELHAQVIEPLSERAGTGLHIEILVRMRDSAGRLVPPGHFLPAAERYNLMGRIDRWVIRNTLDWLLANPESRAAIDICAINLSGLSFGDYRLLDDIRAQLESSRGVHPGKLCFEVTETAAITNLQKARGFIEELKQIGCSFALDDFGSGVSSFGYLKNLPVDILKIDGMFVRDVCNNATDRAIVESINRIGHEMGMLTIAEFAENSAVIDMLREMGVDYAQGFGVSRPAPLDEVAGPRALHLRRA